MLKSFEEFKRTSRLFENPEFDPFRFERFYEWTEGLLEGINISRSKYSMILRFYESTNDYNKTKITDLINNSMSNLDKVHRIVLDYEKIKQQREII